MRSRPLVRLLVGRAPLRAGQPIELDVILTSRSETPTEHVDVTLTGNVVVSIPQGKTTAMRATPAIVPQTFRWTPQTLAVGEYRQRIQFVMPHGVPPSYHGSGWCRVAYIVEVHVVIPMWIDRHAPFALDIAHEPRMPTQGTSALVATNPRGPIANQLYIEAALDSTEVFPGEEASGDISFANVGAKRIRRVTIAFVAFEQTHQPFPATNVTYRYEATLVSGAPPEGESFPFRFTLPRNAPPAFFAQLFEVKWQFHVRADVILGSDVVLVIPLDVPCAPPGQLPQRSRRAPPVGRQRLARLWAIVAARVGMSYDDREGAMLATNGAVTLKLVREAYEGTLGIVAHFRYPHLGLDVHVGERGFLGGIAMRGRFDPAHDAASKRLTIVGREPAQLAAFFDPALLGYLASATSATLDDDFTHVRVAGAAASASALEGVARSALVLVDMLNAAIMRIPPPAAVAMFARAWQMFAAVHGGRFEPGRVWVHDATHDGFRFEMGIVWEPHETKPLGTIVRVPIEPPLDHVPALDDPALSALTREQLRKLEAEPGFHASPEEFAFMKPDPIADPETLLPLVESIAAVLRSIRGLAAKGPFR